MPAGDLLHTWTTRRIEAECHRPWLDYDAARTSRYTAYFKAHPELADPKQAWSARDIDAALPPGWGELASLLPNHRHSQHLSGKSSQLLALALLGVSSKLDSSHRWLWEAFSPLGEPASGTPAAAFEVEVKKSLLGEHGKRRTSIDYLVEHHGMVMCIECKWREDGIGSCSCSKYGGNPDTGACRDVIRDKRPAYWETANDIFGLPVRADGRPCPLSPVYQAVRNVAAAGELSGTEKTSVFGLIYDADNPYFAGRGEWPGWPAVLRNALADEEQNQTLFRAVSWQELLPLLVLDQSTRTWANEKPGLG